MSENMKKFFKIVSENAELAGKIGSMNREELIELSVKLGIALTEADFAPAQTELSDDEIDTVTGAGVCACVLGGGGASDDGSNSFRADDTCACVLGGAGANKGGYSRCICFMGGAGDSCICACTGSGTGA